MQNLTQVTETVISYKSKQKASERPAITRSQDLAKIFASFPTMNEFIEYKEVVLLIALNRANKVLSITKLSEGGCSSSVVDLKQMFQSLILQNASAFALGHNHPSGNLTPSESDIILTRKAKYCGKLLDMTMLDHIILSPDFTTGSSDYYSFSDEGRI